MLARNWKTAAELGITEQQRNALVQVLDLLERGEAEPFYMSGWCYCIRGWAERLSGVEHQRSGDSALFPHLGRSEALSRLFTCWRSAPIGQPEAAHAVDRYLQGADNPWS